MSKAFSWSKQTSASLSSTRGYVEYTCLAQHKSGEDLQYPASHPLSDFLMLWPGFCSPQLTALLDAYSGPKGLPTLGGEQYFQPAVFGSVIQLERGSEHVSQVPTENLPEGPIELSREAIGTGDFPFFIAATAVQSSPTERFEPKLSFLLGGGGACLYQTTSLPGDPR
ncbi:hypothetical protein BSL78_14378 [Apostichopus japonicus]|uniref:Uncharacterized protein n=1 Tax=Stichopus japonicus TaxID=307972 RepID=A0A2G8KLA4_STIJA|nr:hypothetical protein BSL78_14378 [Apostichopus japonicus]